MPSGNCFRIWRGMFNFYRQVSPERAEHELTKSAVYSARGQVNKTNRRAGTMASRSQKPQITEICKQTEKSPSGRDGWGFVSTVQLFALREDSQINYLETFFTQTAPAATRETTARATHTLTISEAPVPTFSLPPSVVPKLISPVERRYQPRTLPFSRV